MPRQLQLIIIGLIALILSVFVGQALVSEDYYLLIMVLLVLPIAIAAIVSPGYEFFLAFALICPFSFPLPYIYKFPFFGLVLGFCCLKFAFKQAMERRRFEYQRAFNFLIL